MPRYQLRGKRKQILLLILGGGLIFITFQFFSIIILNRPSGMLQDDNNDVDIKIVRGNRHRQNPIVADADFAKLDNIAEERFRAEKHEDKLSEENVKKEENEGMNIPLGVHRTDAKRYQPDAENMFHCDNKQKKIPFKWVNDDFCDCMDSSDEPGTSACPQSRFYCTFQLRDRLPQNFPSSRVNDGICDCCDGSDESKGLPPPLGIRQAADKIGTILYAPCKNLCDKLVKEKEEDAKIRRLGKRYKMEYLKAADFLSEEAKHEYGPNGVFYKLSKNCYSHKSAGYEYTVCPFKQVKQQHFPQAMKNIGQRPVWKSMSDGLYVLNMDEGDGHLCPDGFSRTSVITFICGIHDRVVQISEDDKCLYNIKFATPAAC